MERTTQTLDYKKIALMLNQKYSMYNRPEYIEPDPLMVVREYHELRNRELAAFIAAHFALGRAGCISEIARTILNGICLAAAQKTHKDFTANPLAALLTLDEAALGNTFKDFVYRFFTTSDLISLLLAVRSVYESYGSLETLFEKNLTTTNRAVVSSLTLFVNELENANPRKIPWKSNLVPSPKNGSACKRMMLFLRWMVRKDAIDPGGWTVLSPAELLVPLDTHAVRSYRQLGFITTNAVTMKTVLEVTEHLRHIAPDDPLQFDFVLSRPYASCE